MRPLAIALMGLLMVASLAACAGLALESTPRLSLTNADSGRTVAVPVGGEIDITLQTIGPGEYTNPQVSSSAVRFLSMSYVNPPVPGGPTQLFRFGVVAAGQATISIQGSDNNRVFKLTVTAN